MLLHVGLANNAPAFSRSTKQFRGTDMSRDEEKNVDDSAATNSYAAWELEQ